MKVIKKKNKPLIISILALVLAVLIAAAIILTVVLGSKDETPDEQPPLELLPGEAELSGSTIAYSQVKENKFLLIRIESANGEYALMRPEDGTKEIAVTDSNGNQLLDEEGNPMTEKVNEEEFLLYYQDENGQMQVYYPAIADADPSFEYEDMYAVETDDTFGTIYKVIYLTTGLGTAYFDQRINLSGMSVDRINEEHKRYGLYGSDGVKVSFTYIDENGAEATHYVKIGDKLVTGSGYYFTVDDRPYIYSTNVDYFSYAMTEFTSFIKPVLTAAGLEMDGAFEPYLTTDYKQYRNSVHKGGDICKVKGCEDGCVGVVGEKDRVILDASAETPYETKTPTDVYTDGYLREPYKSTLFDLSSYASDASYSRLVKALVGRGAGSFASPVLVTLPSYSNIVELTNGQSKKYTYTIYEIEAILKDNGDVTESGAAVGATDLIRVRYQAKLDGENLSVYPMHAVIDLSSAAIPAEVKAKLTSIGTLSEAVSFDLIYTPDNAKTRNVKMIISDIVEILDKDDKAASKVAVGTSVLYHYYLTVDGVRIEGDFSDALEVTDSLTGDAKTVADAIMGRGVSNNVNIEAISYTEYDEIFADFLLYRIRGIKYFVKSECIVSFEFEQASERDPYYGESVYKNTLDNKYAMYALNASVCERVAKILGGVTTSTTSSEGLVGTETVAIGITPDIMEKYGLYAHTVYFELPRGITTVSYDSNKQTVNEYLNTLDDYNFYSTLGFTLYISEENPDGTRYIASDLYDVVAKVSAEDFIFLDYDFVEFYARRNLVLTNISNIKNVSFDFFMEEIYGSYSNELTHQALYAYGGKLTTEDKLTEEQLSQASPYDAIRVFVTPSENASATKFSQFYGTVPGFTVGGVNYGVSLHSFFENKLVELDTLGTSNFKELMEIIFYTRYENVLTEEEQAAGLANAPMLMKMTVTLGEAYGKDDTVHSTEAKEGIYMATSSYDYAYEFYRVSDRRIMVRLYREDRATSEVRQSVSDFYISTFAFKKIVNGYVSILNGQTIDNDVSYPENAK